MKHIGTSEIKTDRLTLRRFRAGDEQAMFKNYFSDTEVTKYLRFANHTSVDQTAERLQVIIDAYQRQNEYIWAVVPNDVGEVIGMVALMGKTAEIDECYELVYMIGKNFWGKGYVTEATRAMLHYGFEQVGVNRIEANHATVNPASGAVMKKIGLKFEGRMPQKSRVTAGLVDILWYGLTRDEYMGTREVPFSELIARAREVVRHVKLSPTADAGGVGAAILTDKNNIYTGVNMDIACGVGFCAEHSAVAAMVTAGESHITKVVAVGRSAGVMPPCGRCRELINQVNPKNRDAQVMVSDEHILRLKELMPYDWAEQKGEAVKRVLTTQRLKLVPINESYIDDVFKNFTEEVTTYMYPAPSKKREESEAFVRGTVEKSEQGIEQVYAITKGDTGEFLGCCGLHHIDTLTPELGIWTKKAAHGHGYGFETISRLIACARDCLSYEYIKYPVARENYPSRRIPILHGGVEAGEYKVKNASGNILNIVEYHLF